VAGLVFGARKPAGVRLGHCLAGMAVLMTLPWAAAATIGSLPALAGALLIAGMATAPTMVTAMTLVQSRTPADRLNEGMSLVVTALLTGIACGSATGGWVVEHLSPTTAYAVPATAAALALLIHACRRWAEGVNTRRRPRR
jgi:predicted MFS family arabinose efflux permease